MHVFYLKDITPYITCFGPIAALIGIMDYLIRDDHKSKIWNLIMGWAQIGKKPFSLAFYGLIVCGSIYFTLVILSISGIIEHKSEGTSAIIGLKSSGPILFAVILKITILDYLLAIKSYSIIQWAIKGLKTAKKTNLSKKIYGGIFIGIMLFDIYITANITGGFLNWAEEFQTTHIDNKIEAMAIQPTTGNLATSSADRITPSTINLENATAPTQEINQPFPLKKEVSFLKEFIDFFDSMDFFVKDSIQKSFYALNGTLIMYALMILSLASEGIIKYLNVEDMRKNIFKIIATLLVVTVLIVAISRETTQ